MTDRDGRTAVDRRLLRSDLTDAGEVAVAGFGGLWRGHPVEVTALLPGRSEESAEAVAGLVARGRAEVDGSGRLVGVHGLTVRASRHSFVRRGVARHTWCAFDSIGIPAALRLDAVATTDCPTCGSALSVEVWHGSVRGGPLALWLPVPDESSDLLSAFCAVADLYCSKGHLEQRIDVEHAPGTVVSVAEAAEIGRDVWSDVADVDLNSTDRIERTDCV